MAQSAITGFHVDESGDWVADLACGHAQHVRHQPPWQNREWVLTERARADHLGTTLDCLFCNMPTLPHNAVIYKQTKEFNSDTVPKGLLANHQTKPGTWGCIVVLDGSLLYTIEQPKTASWMLRPGVNGIVAPAQLHRVRPHGHVRFRVEFLRVDSDE